MNNSATRASETRQRILDVAARQFRNLGYAGVSLRGIARETGMKAGSLYYHFDSKEEIVVSVLDTGTTLVHDAVRQVLDEAPAGTDPDEMLKRAMTTHLAAFLTWSDYTSANVRIYGQVPDSVKMSNRPARQRYERLWDKLLDQLSEAGMLRDELELRAIRVFLLGAMNATLEWFDPARGDIETLAAQYAEILLHGVIKQRGLSS